MKKLLTIFIIGIFVAIALAAYSGLKMRMKMAELYTTVSAIAKAEEIFYAKHGFYAADDEIKEHKNYWLPYTDTQENIDRFKKVLGIKMPGANSVFIYGVYYHPEQIYVRVREHPGDPSDGGWWVLCSIPLAGSEKGKWVVYAYNPLSKYLKPPAKKIMDYTFVKK